eukprot:5398909-Prymnesium_polylepis.1
MRRAARLVQQAAAIADLLGGGADLLLGALELVLQLLHRLQQRRLPRAQPRLESGAASKGALEDRSARQARSGHRLPCCNGRGGGEHARRPPNEARVGLEHRSHRGGGRATCGCT